MNMDQHTAFGAKDDEIANLIETVHKSMQRLEVLTSAEVGTLSDWQGRTNVLQLAQEQLRQREVAKQAAILNALPANIALLDFRGIVISVNDGWQRFAVANRLPGAQLGVGLDYLAVCESARGAGAIEAQQAAAGIRTVLNGTETSFSLEYACHSPTQQRWFLMSATPLNDENRMGAIVMHLDVSERRLAECALAALTQKTEKRECILSTTLACISDFAYIYDRDCRFLFANQPLLDLWGIPLNEVVGKNFLDLGYTQDMASHLTRDVQRVFDTKTSLTGELPYTSPTGLFGFYEYIFSPVVDSDGSVEFVVGSSRDVTARRLAIEAVRISEQEQRQLAEQLEIERSRLVAAQRVAKVGSWEMDVSTMSLLWSAETHRIHETDPVTFQPTFQSYLERVHPGDREVFEEYYRQSLCHGGSHVIEHRVTLPDGSNKIVEDRWSVSLDQSGTPIRSIGTCQDITERKAAEARVIHLSRVYAMLSGINNLIVRATSRDELFKEACAIAVEAGGFRMSLIAIVDPNTMRIVPVASTGKDEALLADIQELLASAEGARSTMVAKAIRDKEIAVANDSLNDPRLVFGGKYAEAGVRSMAIFPLIVSNVAVGVFTMYASEIEFFREEELKLLADLAGDIAFAIDHIDKQELLNYLAYFDVLTGLPNRTLLNDRLEQGTRAARRNDGLLAVMSVDLDNFKAVNDTLGHTVGDALLREVANRLVSCVRDTDTVGRLGGDEFLILLPEIGSSEDAAMVARKLIESCARPYLIAGHELFVSASMGITLFPTDAAESETLIRNADTAMYRAKELGRNTYQFFTAEMNRNTQEKLDLERDLRHALSRGEFLIHYQPKVSCTTGKITGFEALLRWQHPLRGLVGPVAFIPLLEESRLIVAVGEWVLTNACVQAQRWHDTGLGTPCIAVNISGRQIEAGDLCETVKVALATSGLAPAFLELELTESQLMKNAAGTIALLQRVKAMGVKISIDDFGTGFSSLAYLKRFPIDCLKVDRAFVKDIIADTNDVSITRAIITLAHNLKLKVVAEGVETEGQLGLLIANQCDEVQGYYFSRPLGAEDATALLRTRPSLDSRMIASMQRSRTLLLVDDEENIISSLKRLLRQDGYTILTASGAEQGLELLATHSVDVVVSDQRLPGIGGIEFLRRIKTLHPHTVRLVLSGYTDLQAVTDAVNDGAIYKFLTKPWDDGILRAQIKEAFLKKETADENRHTGPPNMFEDIGVIQDVINAIPAAIFAKDATSRFVLVNKACESQWGMSASDLRGTDGSQVFPADQMASFLAKDKEIFARGYLLDYEETYWNAELKQNRFGHTFKKPVFDAAGNPLYLVCVTVDITERRLATDKLLRSEEKLREVAPGKRSP